MKQFILLCLMIMIGVMGWHFGSKLSSDAVSMGIGVLFGVMAGVPAALMVLASSRRRLHELEEDESGRRGQYSGYAQPPVIVVTGAPQQPQLGHNPYQLGQQYAMGPGSYNEIAIDGRDFKVVGEKEEWIDEW